jgi:hypothetical protein
MPSAQFGQDYRVISWAYSKFTSNEQRRDFSSIASSTLSNAHLNPYIGACFGKYSHVIDFWNMSGKVASYHLTRVQKAFQKKDMICSLSTLLCKPIEEGYKEIQSGCINVYTFFKPDFNCLPICDIIKNYKTSTKKLGNTTEAYWNNSMYPFLVVSHGENYDSVIEQTQNLRAEAEWAIDSSSYVTLKIQQDCDETSADTPCSKIPAMVFLKLSSMKHIEGIRQFIKKTRKEFPEIKADPNSPFFRFGWYDVCDIVYANSLSTLYKYVQTLKENSEKTVTFTSTLLLKGGE